MQNLLSVLEPSYLSQLASVPPAHQVSLLGWLGPSLEPALQGAPCPGVLWESGPDSPLHGQRLGLIKPHAQPPSGYSTHSPAPRAQELLILPLAACSFLTPGSVHPGSSDLLLLCPQAPCSLPQPPHPPTPAPFSSNRGTSALL